MSEEKPQYNIYLVALSIILPTFFAMVATSATNVCLPHIAGYFGATQYETNTVVTSYFIANAIMIPLTGWLIRLFGYKKLSYLCIALFAIGSFLCIVSPNLVTIILSRIIQGCGGGPLVPICQAILIETFPKEKVSVAMALFGLATMIPPLIGPFFGGVLTEFLSWQWVFIINIPICILSLILIKIFIKEKPKVKTKDDKNNSVDFVGISCIAIWLISLQIVLDKGEQFNWFDTSWICILTFISIFALTFFIVWEFEYSKPFLNIRVFKDKNFLYGTMLAGTVHILLYTTLLLAPSFVQSLLKYSPFMAGYSVMFRTISCAILLLVVGKIANYINNKIIIVVGLSIFAYALYLYSNMNLTSSLESIIVPNLLLGAGVAVSFVPISNLTFATIPAKDVKDGASLHSLYKCTIAAVMSSMVSTFVARQSQFYQTILSKNLSNGNIHFQEKLLSLKTIFAYKLPTFLAAKKSMGFIYKQHLAQAKLFAFHDVFLLLTLLALISIPLIFLLKNNKKKKA